MAESPVLVDRIFIKAKVATLRPGAAQTEALAIAVGNGRIIALGPDEQVLSAYRAEEIIDLEGRLVTPGVIDCHTHLIHGGNRAGEFEQRLSGVSYETISRNGGGIMSTVRATRAASDAALIDAALVRLDSLIAEGVTTIEIKSGYGLDLPTEMRMLTGARALETHRPISVATTYLAAHALPPEFAGRADDFIDLVTDEHLPLIAERGLADAVDAFCETIAFSAAQTARLFQAATDRGIRVKLHADQLSNLHGAALAARFHALSADHLEYTDEAGAVAMAEAGTVAVLLPGAFYVLRETQFPPIEAFRRHGVAMALATDCNPGTSPLTSLLLAMNMGATLFRLTIDECLAAVTREAARALGRLGEIGTIEPGKRADLAIWNVDSPAELVYRIGAQPLHARIFKGDLL